jgi:uncharacterized protein
VEFVERNVAGTVVYAMKYARVVALLGPRQAGKSTLARKLAAEQLSADYLSLDDEPVRSLAAGDPAGFIAGLGRRTVIDEIQRAPELLLAIKSRVDKDTAPGPVPDNRVGEPSAHTHRERRATRAGGLPNVVAAHPG